MGRDKKKECVCRLEDSSRRHGCQAPFAMMQKISVDGSSLGRCVEKIAGFGRLCARSESAGLCVPPFLVCTPIIYEIARPGKGFFARGIKISAARAFHFIEMCADCGGIFGGKGGLQPLIAPSITPLTKKRWSSGYRHRIGPEATTISAYFIVSATSSAPMPLSSAAPPCSL